MAGIAVTPTGIILGANVTVGTNAAVTLDASRATDAIALPSGTTAQRPSGLPGEIRFNKSTQSFEGFILAWSPLGGGQIQVQNNGTVVNTTSVLDFSSGPGATLKVTDDYANGRINVFLDAHGSINVEANALNALVGIANLNYNNTSTINVTVGGFQSNTTSNIAFTANVAAIVGSFAANANAAYDQANAAYGAANTALAGYAQANAAANLVAVYANDTLTMANANVNFNNTASINVATSVNATNQRANVEFNLNTTMNLVSLNVSGNISNTGNLLVTQNIAGGNLSITQNATFGNVNTTNLNVSTISGTTTVDFLINGATQFRHRAGGFTYSGAGTAGNVGTTVLIEANGEPSFGFSRPNTAAGNVAGIGVFTFNSVDTDGISQNFAKIEGFIASNTANSGNGRITLSALTANTMRAVLTVNSVYVGIGTVNPSVNLHVAQNTQTGNLTVLQNTTTGNLVISTLANTVTLNVSANIANTGNLLVTQNTFTGNLSVTQNTSGGNASFANVNVSATINTAANLVAGNISTPQNTSTGNLSVTQNTSEGNLTVTQNASIGNLTVTQNATFGNITISSNVTLSNLVAANINGLNSNASLVGVMYISYMGVY